MQSSQWSMWWSPPWFTGAHIGIRSSRKNSWKYDLDILNQHFRSIFRAVNFRIVLYIALIDFHTKLSCKVSKNAEWHIMHLGWIYYQNMWSAPTLLRLWHKDTENSCANHNLYMTLEYFWDKMILSDKSHSIYIYIYIYMCMCVFVCVCVCSMITSFLLQVLFRLGCEIVFYRPFVKVWSMRIITSHWDAWITGVATVDHP